MRLFKIALSGDVKHSKFAAAKVIIYRDVRVGTMGLHKALSLYFDEFFSQKLFVKPSQANTFAPIWILSNLI